MEPRMLICRGLVVADPQTAEIFDTTKYPEGCLISIGGPIVRGERRSPAPHRLSILLNGPIKHITPLRVYHQSDGKRIPVTGLNVILRISGLVHHG